jgi:DNA-binding Lrp family transcriptional regulator
MYKANQRTVEMASFGIEGNVIDHSWYHIIKYENGKTDSNAIIILSDLVYWYRPIYRTDEVTGQQKIYKKFKEDILQRSYADLEKKFGFTKEQSRKALETLEKLGVAERETRTVDMGGTLVSNILFIRFNHEKLLLLMKDHYEEAAELKKSISSSVITDKGIGLNPQASRLKASNTETTSETSSKISLKDNVTKEDIVFCKDKIEDIGKGQYPLKKDQLSLFEEMKALDLGADEKTLTIVFRKAIKEKGVDFLKKCIHHMRLKIDSGFTFRKAKIAFFRNCLSGKQSIITESCIENKQIAEQFCKDMQWHGVKITDKYFEATNGNISKEIPTMLPKNEFERMLTDLYRYFNPLEATC